MTNNIIDVKNEKFKIVYLGLDQYNAYWLKNGFEILVFLSTSFSDKELKNELFADHNWEEDKEGCIKEWLSRENVLDGIEVK
jgi:hypothetical protein